MILNEIFAKPVNRPIDGVIKADDNASLILEVEEYVLTNEVEKRMEQFFEAYNNYENANGVWVSGFYGSGKSHLLKMLALLLENRSIDDQLVSDILLAKCGDNELLRGAMKMAVTIPSKSILFNIDQKADVISKSQTDALLTVFVKVFDDFCGYYGKHGHIAQFERDLDARGLFTSFKSEFRNVAGSQWEAGREQAIIEDENIAKAYAKVTNTSPAAAAGILDKYHSRYKLSIEDFAAQVKTYIDNQGPKFRLNFFVDEVGQYIADNTKLMTNLQTVAESLATKCGGRAWIIVTAQEDMTPVTGEMTTKLGTDFSKIQARFANRMKLTSADVAEVIQKRLLLKTTAGNALMDQLFEVNANNFRTLFDFSDGSQTYRNYEDAEHFAQTYPFVPYQIYLFQQSIQNLSTHNAFEGRHSSVGERSMLGVFQQVAIQIGTKEVGQLATFDLMFEGIRTSLKTNIQSAIINAENNLRSHFAIRVLKALFLLKYVKEFKPSVRNLCVLMTERFDQDVPALRKRVEEALSLLELETYIERNGDLYYFLTDDEKDVEENIKNTDVDGEVIPELEKLVFNHVIKTTKIQYDDNKQFYSFTKKLDDNVCGRVFELSINVITPFHLLSASDESLISRNMGADELLVIMPSDSRLVNDLLMYKKTEKYVRQNVSVTQVENVQRILKEKAGQNRERELALQQRLTSLLGESKLYVHGSPIDITSENAQTRVSRGFQDLITRTYTNLRMIRGATYEDSQVGTYLRQSEQGLYGDDVTVTSEAEQELLAFINLNARSGVRTTFKGIVDKFEKKPYGWYYAAILCNVAKLCARGKVFVRDDSNLLEDRALETNLKNTARAANLVLLPQVEFNATQVRNLKTFYEEMFDSPPAGGDAKALGTETADAFATLHTQLSSLLAENKTYPFLSALEPALADLKEVIGKPYTWYITDLPNHEDTLLDHKENTLDPIRKFMSGSQKGIYVDTSKLLTSNAENMVYLTGELAGQIRNILESPKCYVGNNMQQVKTLADELRVAIGNLVSNELEKAKKTVYGLDERVQSLPEYQRLTTEQKSAIDDRFQSCTTSLDRQKLVAVIQSTVVNFERTDYTNILSLVSKWSQPKEVPLPLPVGGKTGPVEPPVAGGENTEAVYEFVPSTSIKVAYGGAWLANEDDVEIYVNAMRNALNSEIRKGKRIQI